MAIEITSGDLSGPVGAEFTGQHFMPDIYEVVTITGGSSGFKDCVAIRFFPPAYHPVLKEPIIVILPVLAVGPFIGQLKKGVAQFPGHLRAEGDA